MMHVKVQSICTYVLKVHSFARIFLMHVKVQSFARMFAKSIHLHVCSQNINHFNNQITGVVAYEQPARVALY